VLRTRVNSIRAKKFQATSKAKHRVCDFSRRLCAASSAINQERQESKNLCRTKWERLLVIKSNAWLELCKDYGYKL